MTDRRYTIHQDRRTELGVAAEAEEPELELAWSMPQVPAQTTQIHSETLSPAKKDCRTIRIGNGGKYFNNNTQVLKVI